MLPSKVPSCFPCREVIALVNKVMPVYIVFQLFEAVCVSTAVPPPRGLSVDRYRERATCTVSAQSIYS